MRIWVTVPSATSSRSAVRSCTPSRSMTLPDGTGQPDDAVARAVVLLGHPLGLLGQRGDGEPDAAADLGADPLDAALLDEVLQAGPVAVVAVAEVALRRDDGLDDVDDPIRRDPAERLGQQRVGVVLAGVGHAQAAADVDVVAGDVTGEAVGERRHQADVVGQHVDVVVARPGHGDLELAGQVDVAVDRLGERLRPFGPRNGSGAGWAVTAFSPSTHSSQYDAVWGRKRATRSATSGSTTAWRSSGHGRAHDVAHDVAAGGQRGQQRAG